jgi:hypothetical protein
MKLYYINNTLGRNRLGKIACGSSALAYLHETLSRRVIGVRGNSERFTVQWKNLPM